MIVLKQVYKQTQDDHCYLVIVTVFMFHSEYWDYIMQNSTLLLNTYNYKQSEDVGHDISATEIPLIAYFYYQDLDKVIKTV